MAASVAPFGMPEKSTVTWSPVMKAPLKDSLRVSETIFPPAPVPRVRTVTAVAEASTPTLMPLITMAELGPSIRIKSFVPAPGVISRVTVTAPSAPLTSNFTPWMSRFGTALSPRWGNRDGPIAVVILVLRHTRHCRASLSPATVTPPSASMASISAARGTEKCSMIVEARIASPPQPSRQKH